jgi:hypothetical protein
MRLAVCLLAAAIAWPASAADDNAKANAPGAAKEKLVCKREVPVGSLIASRKMCLTKAEWDHRARDGNEEARKYVYENMGRQTSN